MKDKVYVWDSFIRIFHWCLALTFVISYLTGDENENIHVYSGYFMFALLLVRIIWGFIGPQRARFSDFVRPPAEAFAYLKGLVSGDSKKYKGHNPAGGWMTIMLLASLLLTGLSGLKLYGVEGHGPLAAVQAVEQRTVLPGSESKPALSSKRDHDERDEDEHGGYEDEEAEEFWEEIHEFFANSTLFLVILHIAGVLLSSLKQRENLIVAMITGYKNR